MDLLSHEESIMERLEVKQRSFKNDGRGAETVKNNLDSWGTSLEKIRLKN